uniref:Putative serine/threonine protein kinase n=1 Tax=Pithovirus LCPAC403 TaxID=2506596 RepID=A0A481ZD97_9VIRU|nr:MAG: putative serine/threonine protein kinase [Pithovirus LCPAC403]
MTGKLEKLDRLGRGSYGDVYRCYDRQTKSYKAVKTIEGNDKEGLNSLMEYFIVRDVRHKHLISASESYIKDNTMYIVQEVGQDDLSEWRRRFDPSDGQVKKWIFQVVDALLCLWSLDVVHADVKLNNVILMKDNTVRLADFGLSKIISDESVLSCSPEHRSPEAWKYGQISTSIDVWALGCTIVEMMYYHVIFKDQDRDKALKAIKYWDKMRKALINRSQYNAKVDGFKPPSVPSSFSVNNPIDSFVLYLLDPDLRTRPAKSDLLKHPYMKGFTSTLWSVRSMVLKSIPMWIKHNKYHYTKSEDIYNLAVKFFSQLQNQREELSVAIKERELFEVCVFMSFKLLLSTSRHPTYHFTTEIKNLIKFETIILKESDFTVFSRPSIF